MTTILAYEPRHFDCVDRLWRRAFPNDPPYNRAEHAVPAKLALGDDLLLVAEQDGRVVGTVMAGYDGHRGWLYAVAVDPDVQRGGIGGLLVREAEARLAALGCHKVNLQVRVGNEPVIGFYESLGYVLEPRVSMGRRL